MPKKKPASPDFSELSTEELSALVEGMTDEAEKLKQSAAYLHFEPHPYQRPWLEDESQVMALFSGNQVGKSTCGVVALLRECLGVSPISLGGKGERWKRNSLRGKRVLAGGETFEVSIAQNLVPKLKSLVTPDMLKGPPKRNSMGIETKWSFVTGCELTLQSYSSPVAAYEGSVLDFCWLDEPPPQDIFNAIRRGLMAKEGRMYITATPLKEPWLLDELILPAQDPESPLYGTVGYHRVEMHDACKECNGGHLPHAQIEQFLAGLPEGEKAARSQGVFMSLQSVEFSYVNDDWVCPDFEPYPSWPIVEVIDPAARRGLTCIWATCSPTDDWYVFHAAQIPNSGFGEMCREIKKIRKMFARGVDVAIMDARGGAHAANQETRETWFDIFRRNGLEYRRSEETPLQALHDWLKPIWQPGMLEDERKPKLKMTEAVAKMERGPKWALSRFVWSPTATKRDYKQAAKDYVDCLRYCAGAGLTWNRLTKQGSGQVRSKLASSYANRNREKSQITRAGGSLRGTANPRWRKPPTSRGYS